MPLKLCLVLQGLLVAILYCFVNKEVRSGLVEKRVGTFICQLLVPQVQSEMLKKWKRWKLGKDIDEEYRHTHSQTPHIKSGSIATANLVCLHDGHEPGRDSQRFSKAPAENRRLVVSYSNGSQKDRPARSSLRFSFLLQTGSDGQVSTTVEDVVVLEEQKEPLQEGEETNV